MCCQLERSLRRTERSSIGVLPSLLCVIECDREASTIRKPGPLRAVEPQEKKLYVILTCFKYLGVLYFLMMAMQLPNHLLGIETVLLCILCVYKLVL